VNNGTCGLSNLVLGLNEWVQWNGSSAALPLTCRQRSLRKQRRDPRLKMIFVIISQGTRTN